MKSIYNKTSNTLSVEELLKPRYKCIADFPDSSWIIGEITTDGNWSEKYPDVFRELEWWEHRNPEEMPKYVKEKAIPTNVFKVIEWRQSVEMECRIKGELGGHWAGYFIPSTEQEYLNQQNEKINLSKR